MPDGTGKSHYIRFRTVPDESAPSSTAAPFLILASLLCLVTLLVFFREFFFSGFRLIAGDLGDNRLCIAILEHWRAVAHRQEHFTSPHFFWPEPGVLGYGDSMFLLSVPYILASFLGLDHYAAFELALMAFKAVGFFSMLWLLRSVVGVSHLVALIGAVLFTLSNLYFLSVGHAQLVTIVFTPLIAALAVLAWRAYGAGRTALAHAYGVACVIWIALVFFTSFYIGWFTLLTGVGCIVIAFLIRILERRSLSPISTWLQAAFARRQLLGVAGIVFALAMIPFVATYVHVLSQSVARRVGHQSLYSAAPIDALNVGSQNLLWSRIVRPAPAPSQQQPDAASDKRVGWPPFLLLLTIGGGLLSLIQLIADRRRALSLIVICSASALLLWIVSVHVGQWSLWWLVYKVVPGASGSYVPVQLNFVLNVLLVISACLILEQLAYHASRNLRVACGVLTVLLIAEQINIADTHKIDRAAEQALLQGISHPLAGCSSFLLTAPAQPQRPFYANQIDAMLISQALRLPTANGYNSRFPLDWDLLTFDSAYPEHARQWAALHNIQQGLCGLDLRTGSWTKGTAMGNTYAPGQVLDFRRGGNGQPFEGAGWGNPERGGSWTVADRSVLLLKLSAPPTNDLLLTIEAHAFTPPQRNRFDETLMVNGRVAAEWPITSQEPLIRRQVRLPAELIRFGVVRIEFINHDPRSPADLGVSADKRKLGLVLDTVRLDATTYSPGTALDFRAGGNALAFEGEGWGEPEEDGSWTIGAHTALLLQLPEAPASDLRLSIEAHTFTPPQRNHFGESLLINGHAVAQWPISSQETILRRQVLLPADLVRTGAFVSNSSITIRGHRPISGYPRTAASWGCLLRTLRLDPISYSPGEAISFREDGNATPFEDTGWSVPERDGSWTIGDKSALVLQLPAPPTSDLMFSLAAHAFTPPQRSRFEETLMVNGQAVAHWSITDHEPLIGRRVRLPAALIRSRSIRIEFINHDPRSPADLKLGGDARKLGLEIQALQLDVTSPTPAL